MDRDLSAGGSQPGVGKSLGVHAGETRLRCHLRPGRPASIVYLSCLTPFILIPAFILRDTFPSSYSQSNLIR